MLTKTLATMAFCSLSISAVFAADTKTITKPARSMAAETPCQKPIHFLHALTDAPLEFTYRSTQTLTPAVLAFHKSGVNAYAGHVERITEGKKIYKKLCQACHLKNGKGRIGPNLTDDDWMRERTNTEVGRFEILYGGGAGAMQAFGRRIDQDDILKVMAFIDTFRE